MQKNHYLCTRKLKNKRRYVFMTNTILIIMIVVVLIFGFWLIQYSQFRNEEKKRQWDLKRESQKTISPIRLRAYERLALLLERTTPEHLIMELRAKEPEAMSTWTIGQMQQYLLQTIRAEFDHNQSQQIYVSDEVWAHIVHARDEMAAFVVGIASKMPAGATTMDYAKTLLTAYAENGTTPNEAAMEELKNEAKSLM